MTAELSGRRGHSEAAECEGLLLPDDSAGTTWVQLPPRRSPALVGLPRASWRNTRSTSPQAPGPDWFLKRSEATRASTSPAVILCAFARRAAPPTLGEENGKKAGGRPRLLEGSSGSSSSSSDSSSSPSSRNSSISIQIGSSCSPSRIDSSSSSTNARALAKQAALATPQQQEQPCQQQDQPCQQQDQPCQQQEQLRQQ